MNDPDPLPDQRVASVRAENWSRYWSKGAGHSCAGSFGADYEGNIAAWWQCVFAQLHPNQRVLDLATGGGALMRLALKQCASLSVMLDGVDLGEVPTDWVNGLQAGQSQRVRIHARVRMEALPFSDKTFDLVTSQYGLEYSDLTETLLEIRRVLQPAGRLRAILHHADARPVQLAEAELQLLEWLLRPEGLMAVTDQLLESFARAATAAGRAELAHDDAANALRKRFNELQDEKIQQTSSNACPDVLQEATDAIGMAIQIASQQRPAAARERLLASRSQMADGQFRLAELRNHALTVGGIQSLSNALVSAGFAVRTGEVHERQHLMGWWLEADMRG